MGYDPIRGPAKEIRELSRAGSGLVEPGLVGSGLIRSGRVRSCRVGSGRPYPTLPG